MLFRQAIGLSIRELRQQKGLTLRQVAAEAPISFNYLSEVERGRKEPSSEVISGVAYALGISVSELLMHANDYLIIFETSEKMRSLSSVV